MEIGSIKKAVLKPVTIYRGLPGGVYALFAARIVDNAGNFIMPLIALILTEKIGLSASQAGVCATIFVFSQAPFLIWGGRLIDRFGSKRIIVIFNVLGACSYLVCGLLKPTMVMAVFIALASNLFAVASPGFNTLISQITTEKNYKKSYSLVYLGYNLGYAVGPALAGILFNHHLHILFFIDAFTAFAAVALIFFFVDETAIPQTGRTEMEPEPPQEETEMIRGFLRQSPVLIWFSAAFLIYNFSYVQWSFLLPLQVNGIFRGNGAHIYSMLVTINALTVIFLTPATTAVTHRFRTLNMIAAGGVFYVASFFIFGISRNLLLFIASVVVLTVGQILVNLNSAIFITQKTPRTHIGRANSVLNIVNGAGFAIGPVIMGYVITGFSYSISWFAVGILMLFSTVGMYALSRYDRKHFSSDG